MLHNRNVRISMKINNHKILTNFMVNEVLFACSAIESKIWIDTRIQFSRIFIQIEFRSYSIITCSKMCTGLINEPN